MEDELRVRLAEAKLKAAARRKPCQEVVFAHVLVPILMQWVNDRPKPPPWEAEGYKKRVFGELADAARMPPRRLYGLLHGEDVSVNLDTADRLMDAIGQHISFVEEGIVTTLEADAYARWQRGQIRAWWEGQGNQWPDAKGWRKQMTGIRRRYYDAHKEVTVA